MICVNKFDLSLALTREIESYAEKKGITYVGRIPFDPIFTKAMVQGQTVFEYNSGSKVGREIESIWQRLIDNIS